MSINVAIDGPAGAGKSTIAKRVAKELGFVYVDTGAMYRAMALFFLKHGIDEDDERQIASVCDDICISIVYKNGEQRVLLNGEDVTGQYGRRRWEGWLPRPALRMCQRKTGFSAAAAGKEYRCDHGWKRYWYLCAPGCPGKNLFDGKLLCAGKAPL